MAGGAELHLLRSLKNEQVAKRYCEQGQHTDPGNQQRPGQATCDPASIAHNAVKENRNPEYQNDCQEARQPLLDRVVLEVVDECRLILAAGRDRP